MEMRSPVHLYDPLPDSEQKRGVMEVTRDDLTYSLHPLEMVAIFNAHIHNLEYAKVEAFRERNQAQEKKLKHQIRGAQYPLNVLLHFYCNFHPEIGLAILAANKTVQKQIVADVRNAMEAMSETNRSTLELCFRDRYNGKRRYPESGTSEYQRLLKARREAQMEMWQHLSLTKVESAVQKYIEKPEAKADIPKSIRTIPCFRLDGVIERDFGSIKLTQEEIANIVEEVTQNRDWYEGYMQAINDCCQDRSLLDMIFWEHHHR